MPQGASPTVAGRAREGQRVLFIGLDGGDWRLFDRFMADGTMPELAKLVKEGEKRVLLTQHPPLSPLVWTSMMTGVSPLEHRILDFTRFHPETGAQEPITSDERAVPAIWNMAAAGGKRALVYGLWATFPPEPGIAMSDRDVPREYRLATNHIHRTAMKEISEKKPDLAIVYFQGTDEIGHFTGGKSEQAREYFRGIDAMLGNYAELAEDLDATLILASDHGFDWDGVHDESSTATTTAAKWHRNEGIYLRWPGKGMGEPARVNQICATLLALLGLPRAEGIAPAIGVEENAQSVRYVERRRLGPPGGNSAAEAAAAPQDESIAKLKALGYLSSTAPAPAHATTTRTPASFNNEGLLLREAKRDEEAERAFRESLRIDPSSFSARKNLDDVLHARAIAVLKAGDCRRAYELLREIHTDTAAKWAGLAAAEGCLGNDAAAEEAVRRSLALDPNQPELRRLVD